MPSKAFLKLNPDYAKKIPRSFEALQKTPRQVLAEKRQAIEKAAGIEGSPFERAFLRAFTRSSGADPAIHPVREHRFRKTRKWRFDFAWPDARVFVELEGGTWVGGRHNRGTGFANDCEKYNAATLDGWSGFRIPTGSISYALVDNICEFIRARQQAA